MLIRSLTMCEDMVNHRRYRTDHILKDNGIDVDGLTMDQNGRSDCGTGELKAQTEIH